LVSNPTPGTDAIALLGRAYAIKPKDTDLNSLIIHHLSNQLEQIKEGDKAIKLLDSYCLNFGELCQSSSVNLIKVHSYLDMAYRNFSTGNTTDGDANLKKSEQLCSQYQLTPDMIVVERGYVSAAKYYFNKGNKPKAKSYLLKGFEYAPASKMILDKLKLVQ
jgi:hypothetical protein